MNRIPDPQVPGRRGRRDRRRTDDGAGPTYEHVRRHHPGRPDPDAYPPHRPDRGGGPTGEGPRGGGRGGGRGRRGPRTRRDVRGAVLAVLLDEPMHGYQVMQAIAERSGGTWQPSPGAVYPVLSQLEDEALVAITQEAGRKVATLTDAGREAAQEAATSGRDPFLVEGASAGPGLRDSVSALTQAAREVARNGTPSQRERARKVVDDARRQLYLLLAEDPDAEPQD